MTLSLLIEVGIRRAPAYELLQSHTVFCILAVSLGRHYAEAILELEIQVMLKMFPNTAISTNVHFQNAC